MKKLIALTSAAIMAATFTVAPAAAKKMKRHHSHASQSVRGSYTGGNAAMSGNNGNSGQGSNSLGHIKGGNLGGGS